MHRQNQIKKLKKVPPKPGIYFFKNEAGKIIYIGKALSLKHRLKNYFQKNITDPKTKLLVSQIADFHYQLVPSEFEALLLEAKLIKEHRPKYNIQLKDGKSYLYIVITKKPYRVFAMRQTDLQAPGVNGLLDWFGPFPSGSDVRQVLRTVRRVFPFCSDKNIPKRQCLYSHIGLCPGYQNLSSEAYRLQIRQIRQILSGQNQLLVKNLEKQMREAGRTLRFEEAQAYKQKLQSLQSITSGWKNVPKESLYLSKALLKLRRLLVKYQNIDPTTISKIEGYDVSNLGRQIIVGAMVSFVQGQPDKSLYRKFKIVFNNTIHDRSNIFDRGSGYSGVTKLEKTAGQNDPEGIHQILSRRLNHNEWLYPQLILVDGGQVQLSAAARALREKSLINQIGLIGLTKEKEILVIPRLNKGVILGWKNVRLSRRSPMLQLLQQVRDESHRFAQKYYRQLHRIKTLI